MLLKTKNRFRKTHFSDVSLIVQGKTCEFNNEIITAKFNQEACIELFKINNVNLTNNLNHNRSFYLDCNGGAFRFLPDELIIIENNNKIAHICYKQKSFNNLDTEYHILMNNETAGIYSFIKITNNTDQQIILSELRLVYRFDPTLMKKAFNGLIKGILPLYKDLYKLPKIQDETWQLINGNYYTKYDFAGYVRNSNYYGLYNNNYGVWIINGNHEYYSGGPLKQDLLVHQDSLMLNYLTSSHFGTPNIIIPTGWSKLYGPWLIYVNKFNNEEEMILDLNTQANIEKNKIPYNWTNDSLYPLDRRTLKGRIIDNIKATVVIHSSLEEEFDKQTLGYSYFTNTDENGYFQINNIRPNDYKINIYPISGYNCEVLLTSTVSLLKDDKDLGEFNILTEEPNIIWAISQTNRKSNNFKFCDNNRNYIWQLLTNKELNLLINNNNIDNQLYYAQTKQGTWIIKFNDKNNSKNRILRIGIAATSNSSISKSTIPHLQILFNNTEIYNQSYINDKTIYRSALNSGNYKYILLTINSSLIIEGLNQMSLVLKGGAFMYDCMNYSYSN